MYSSFVETINNSKTREVKMYSSFVEAINDSKRIDRKNLVEDFRTLIIDETKERWKLLDAYEICFEIPMRERHFIYDEPEMGER